MDKLSEEYLDTLDDYTYYGTLGFNLYISRENPDGTRYIASEAFDLIAKIDSSKMEFLNYGFTDFYARRNLILANVKNMAEFNVEFFMDDLYGTYNGKLNHEELYVYNGKTYSKSALTAEQLSLSTKVDGVTVVIKPEGECVETEFSKALAAANTDYMSLFEFYDREYVQGDTKGTDNFREFIQMIFYTYYGGTKTPEEQEELLEGADMLMRISLSMGDFDSSGSYSYLSAYEYVYEFYRVSDREVMVKVYQRNRTNHSDVRASVSDFYISTFAFKKIANAYLGILNKEDISIDSTY
jgi:hypothetical protein